MEHSEADPDAFRKLEEALVRAEEALRQARAELLELRSVRRPSRLGPTPQPAPRAPESSGSAAAPDRPAAWANLSGYPDLAVRSPPEVATKLDSLWLDLLSARRESRELPLPDVISRMSAMAREPERFSGPEAYCNWVIDVHEAAEGARRETLGKASEFGTLLVNILNRTGNWLASHGVSRLPLEEGASLASWRLNHHYLVRRTLVGRGISGTVAAVHQAGWYRPADDSVVRVAEIDVNV